MNARYEPRDSQPPIGFRVRQIRQRRHITQAQLARLVGIHNGPMNQIEKGDHIPSGRVLIKLAEVLEVSLDELCGQAPSAGYVREAPASYGGLYSLDEDTACALPPLATTDPGMPGREMLDRLTRQVLALEDLCGVQKQARVPMNLPLDSSERGAEYLAMQLRRILGVGEAVVFDYVELLENAGLRVFFADLPAGAASLVCLDRPNGNVVIVIGNDFTAERKLFRLLFELGRVYWNMHRLPRPRPVMLLREETLDEEHFARKFAAFFLMPDPAVRMTVGQLGIEPGDWTFELALRIKHRFGVSAETFVIRLEELKLIDLKVADQIKRRIRAHYKKTGNGEPDNSRRLLSENGRLGDLLTTALARRSTTAEARRLADDFYAMGLQWGKDPGKGIDGSPG